MFTGLIEHQGRILLTFKDKERARLVIDAPFEKVEPGESIAVNGVCLTQCLVPSEFQALGKTILVFDLSPETLEKTQLQYLKRDTVVNLERALRADTRLGGHYVTGHIDTFAEIQGLFSGEKMQDTPENKVFTEVLLGNFAHFPKTAARYCVPKGSITVDGVSLTINAIDFLASGAFQVRLMLVPYTLEHTSLGALSLGQQVNIEFDYFARIVAHQLDLQQEFIKRGIA